MPKVRRVVLPVLAVLAVVAGTGTVVGARPTAPAAAPPLPQQCQPQQRTEPWPSVFEGPDTDDAFRVIVALETDGGGTDAVLSAQRRQEAAAVAVQYGVALEYVYGSILTGFSGKMSKEAFACLAKFDTRVRNVEYSDYQIAAAGPAPEGQPTAPQVVPVGLRRVGGDRYPAKGPDGRRGPVDADIAVTDSGVDVESADLTVAGGKDCVIWDGNDSYDDDHGHGTMVASAAAARDNEVGTVGSAPGARIWAVKTYDRDGNTNPGAQMCALDWVAENAGVIDVVNSSGGGPWLLPNVDRTRSCRSSDPGYDAICLLVERHGVPFVTITGNEPRRVSAPDGDPYEAMVHPGGYDQVITVSGLADYDGSPGGLAQPTCPDGFGEDGLPDLDDSFDNFSGYGQQVDLIAPSVCRELLGLRGKVVRDTGTSFAAPLVAGAVALHRQVRPGASPAQVVADLRSIGSGDWDSADDPDGIREPLLDLTGLATLTAPPVPPAGSDNAHLGTGPVDVWRTAARPEFPLGRYRLPAPPDFG